MDLSAPMTHPLTGTSVPTGGDQVKMLTAAALAIIAVAQWADPGTGAELALLIPAVAAFALRGIVRRSMPEVFAAAVIVPVAVVVSQDGHLEGTFFLTTLATLYSAWHLGTSLRGALILAVATATPWFVATQVLPHHTLGWEAWSSACVFTFGLGLGLRRQGALIMQLEQAQEALAEQAVAEERRRIARELHDLAGHTLAAVLLHVTGARHVLRRDLDEAERALLDAETLGRSSLDQIRATVAALRTDERGTDPALAGSADLSDLVDEYRRAGLDITLDLAPAAASIEGPAGTALHRIVREALANVARHAPHNRVLIEVDRSSDVVQLAVTDHGRPATAADPSAGHFGLVGMRERARAFGGDLHAGPTADGWQVAAHLRAPVGHDEQLSS